MTDERFAALLVVAGLVLGVVMGQLQLGAWHPAGRAVQKFLEGAAVGALVIGLVLCWWFALDLTVSLK